MGPPGAGKGTQGEILERHLDVPRYSTGDILRQARREGTAMGLAAQRYMDAGELVPDEVILGIIGEALQKENARNGFVLDGFPRTVAQAEGLGRILDDLGIRLDAILNISVEDDEIVRRLSSRRVCSDCGIALVPGGDNAAAARCAAEHWSNVEMTTRRPCGDGWTYTASRRSRCSTGIGRPERGSWTSTDSAR